MTRSRIALVILALALPACSLAVPQVTPTLIPSRTPSPTPEETRIAEVVPSRTPLSTPTLTLTASLTPSATATGTATPSVTPTVTNTPTNTLTPSSTPTPTDTLTPTATNTGTATPSATPSNTSTSTSTFTPTRTPTPTATLTPTLTLTPAPTLTPSVTPLPLVIPTATTTQTPTATLTYTPTPSTTPQPTPTVTFTPSDTPVPTIDLTRFVEEFHLTETAFAVRQSTTTATPKPSPTATSTLSGTRIAELLETASAIPQPTLNVTPTRITATPGGEDLGIIDTPIPSSDTPEPNAIGPTFTAAPPTPAPTVFVSAPIPPTLAQPPVVPTFLPFIPNVQAFAFSGSGVIGAFTSFPGGIGTAFISYNPRYAESYARVDTRGMLYLAPPGGGEGTFTDSPFFVGFDAPSEDVNKNRVIDAKWSPNGQFLAILISSGPSAGDRANDGVWYWQPDHSLPTDPTYQILRDCRTCGSGFVNAVNAESWRSLSLEWSSDSQAILVSLDLQQEGRRGITVRQGFRDTQLTQANQGPLVLRYDYGHWAADGQHLVVSGRGPDGQVVFGFVDRDGNNAQLTSAASIGLGWAQDAVQRGGDIVMLGSQGGLGSPVQIFNGRGQALTGTIGDGAPRRVEWNCDRSAADVLLDNGRRFIARVNGSITEITGQVGRAPAGWVCAGLPPGTQTTNAPPQSAIPSGVVAGSRYQPGQQLVVLLPQLNLRSQPTTNQANVLRVLGRGDYVAILAGPYQAEGAIWWQVQIADGTVGWIAGTINGADSIGS